MLTATMGNNFSAGKMQAHMTIQVVFRVTVTVLAKYQAVVPTTATLQYPPHASIRFAALGGPCK